MRRIETGADEIEDAAELEIVADDLSEECGMVFGGVGARSKIGNGEARFFYAETGAGLEPRLLRAGRTRSEEKRR